MFYSTGVVQAVGEASLVLPTMVAGSGARAGRPAYAGPGADAEELSGMRVFTRAKELTNMRVKSGGEGEAGEMLVLVTTDVAADDGRQVASTLVPQVYTMRLDAETGAPRSLEVLSASVFPAYLTTVEVAGGAQFLMYLAQEGGGQQSYAPLNPLAGQSGFDNATRAQPYRTPTRLSVFASDGVDEWVVRAAAADNVGRCTHAQGHPSFTAFGASIVFVFDDGLDTQLYKWTPGTEQAATVALRGTDGTEYAPRFPPLRKGYAGMHVVPDAAAAAAVWLVLPLAASTQEQDPPVPPTTPLQDSGCLAVAGCQGVDNLLHGYQKGFECYRADRGNVELHAVGLGRGRDALTGGYEIFAVHDVDGDAAASDPMWVHAAADGRGFYWVGHPGGATNLGVRLTREAGGAQQHPTPQFSVQEKQVLYYTQTDGVDPWQTHVVWGAYAPVGISGLATWGEHLLFWAYDPAELNKTYDSAALKPANSECFPPGRMQGVISADAGGTPVYTEVMAGVNAPAYAGCARSLHAVTVRPATGVDSFSFDRTVLHAGSEHDGAGVPRAQCCPDSFESDVARDAVFPDPLRTAARTCRVGDAGCAPGASVVPGALPRGCLAACGDVYPSASPPALDRYSTRALWTRPHAGWWHAGYQSAWEGGNGSGGGGAAGGAASSPWAWRRRSPRWRSTRAGMRARTR